MANPIFNALGNSSSVGGFQGMLREFQKFKATFQGDPKKEVEKLLQSGRINQQQLNQLQEMAKQFQQLIS